MKLYIKQKIFSFADSYNVLNEYEEPIYQVNSEMLTIGAKIHINDLQGQELFFIKQKLTFMFAKYEIYKGDILCAVVQQEPTFFRPKLTVSSNYGDFDIQGEFWCMDFEISKEGRTMGTIEKAWMTWGDSYKLDVVEGEDTAFFTALVIAIDNCLHNGNNN